MKELKKYLKEAIIEGKEIKNILNKKGLYIKDSTIEVLKDSRVNLMSGNSRVNEMWENSQVKYENKNAGD